MTGEDGRQHKANADPVNHCTNLDLPLDVEDSGSTTMGEQQEDPAAAMPPGSTAAAWKSAWSSIWTAKARTCTGVR